jgi:hypothetical protein
MAQGFIPTATNISAIAFYLHSKSGSPDIGYRVWIDEADANFYPVNGIGGIGGSTLITNASLVTGALTKYSLSSVVSGLTAGNRYVIVIAPWNTTTNAWASSYNDFRTSVSNPYANGRRVHGDGSYSSWFAPDSGNADIQFRTYYDDALSLVIDQEGFRFRNDDGDEDGATWIDAQDTDITREIEVNTRLRLLLNATGDPPSSQYRLEYKKSSDSVWLPITAESASINNQIISGLDDAEEYLSDDYTDTTSSDIEILTDGGEETIVGLRFQNVQIPQGATITNAYVRFIVDVSQSGSVAVDIYGEDADNSVAIVDASSNNISNRTKTTATVNWNVGGSGAGVNTAVDTVDISSIIQEIVNRAGWVAGNSIMIIFQDPTTSNFREFESYDGESGDAPRLIVDFDTPNAFILSPSANITASGENTTAQLTAPSGKTTSDFDAGRIQDDENPTDAIDITSDDYTEVEWCIQATANAENAETYQFRVTRNGTVLSTYSVTPEWTIGSGAPPSTWKPQIIMM